MTEPNENTALYAIKELSQAYNGRTVLNIDYLAIPRRSIIGLTGPNGSGKSTLLRILGFLEDPMRGEVIFEGKPCSSRHNGIRRKVTLLPQEPYLLKRSVHANVAYGLKVRGRRNTGDRVAQALKLVGLSPERFGQRSWHELSGGEAQRVALAARLILRPEVLLLDEPTANLDAESTKQIKEASLAARRDWGATLVIANHDMNW
ncbi:MAG: ATP-binding cassette domain-containing protein, partial [Desulfobacteria bacterium]